MSTIIHGADHSCKLIIDYYLRHFFRIYFLHFISLRYHVATMNFLALTSSLPLNWATTIILSVSFNDKNDKDSQFECPHFFPFRDFFVALLEVFQVGIFGALLDPFFVGMPFLFLNRCSKISRCLADMSDRTPRLTMDRERET